MDQVENARKAKLDSSEVVISLIEEKDDGSLDEERSSDDEVPWLWVVSCEIVCIDKRSVLQ